MNIKFPKSLSIIIDRIISHGIKLYIVGGFVRDTISGIDSKDFDLVHDADLEKILPLLHVKNPQINYSYEIINFKLDKYNIELARMRSDYNYTGRHSEIRFVDSIEDDLPRRDFTVNALAVDLKNGKLYDLFNGKRDIEEKKLRTIGDPDRRFTEDAFRMIRCASFAVRKNFSIHYDTLDAIHRNRSLINQLSKGLVKHELLKMLRHPNNINFLKIMQKAKLIEIIFDVKNLKNVIYKDFEKTPASAELILSYMFVMHNVDADTIKTTLSKLNFSKATTKSVSFITQHFYGIKDILDKQDWQSDEKDLRKIAMFLGSDLVSDILDILNIMGYRRVVLEEYFPNIFETIPISGSEIKNLFKIDDLNNYKSVRDEIRYQYLRGKINDIEEIKLFAETYLKSIPSVNLID